MAHREIKSPRLAREPNERASILHLAEETIFQIVESGLSTSDILRLRVTSSHFTPVCSTVISKHLTTLYIHPSPRSLRQTLELCAHPILAQEIQEVILLGKVLWHEIGNAWPGYRAAPESQYSSKKSNKWHSMFRAWPLIYPSHPPKARLDRSIKYSLYSGKVPGFPKAYAPLLRALALLPRLRKLTFAESVEQPGWNQTARTAIEAFAKGRAQAEGSKTWAVTSALHGNARKGVPTERADAEILMDLLLSTEMHFSELVIKTELPFVGILMHEPDPTETGVHRAPVFIAHQQARLAQLTSLELHVAYGWKERTKWHYFCRALLASPTQLEHLQLVYRPNPSVRKARDEWSSRFILYTGDGVAMPMHWPKLKSFALISQPRSEEADGRPSRPICHLLEIEEFITSHAATLERVEFRNVTFAGIDPGTPPTASFTAGLDALRTCKKLEQVEWMVNRFRHDERCKHASEPNFVDCEKYECGEYCHMYRQPVDDVERVAEKLGVGLDRHGRVWDFGKLLRSTNNEEGLEHA